MLTSVGRRGVHGTAAAIAVTSALSVATAAGLIPMPRHADVAVARVAAAGRPGPSPSASSSRRAVPPSVPPATVNTTATTTTRAAAVEATVAAFPAKAAAQDPATTVPAQGSAPTVSGPASARAGSPQAGAPARVSQPSPAVPTVTAPTATTAPATTTAPASTVPSAPVASGPPPRTQPSAAQVQQAIVGLGSYVQSILAPNASQVAQVGNLVCTAFDQGKTYGQISQQVQSELAGLPLTTVRPGASSYVIATAVHLYCPAYTSRLG